MIWEAKTEHRKLSLFAETFFRQLAHKLGSVMLLTKGELHRLIQFADLSATAQAEVRAKLDLLEDIFSRASAHGEQVACNADSGDDSGAAD